MSLHQALQMESTVRNCAGIPQYILILAELLEYNEWDNIDIKKEIPHWLRKDAKALKCSTQTPYDSLNLKDKKHAQPQRKKGFNESNRGDSFKHPSENPSVTPDQIRYRESKRAKKRREKKIKKITAKNDNTNSPFISKNAKKKLRPIQEEEEIERGKSPEKVRHQFVEAQQMEDHGVEEVTVGYKPILKKKFTGSDGVETDQDQEGLKKSQSFVIKDQQSIDPVMKKHLSFNFEPSKHVGLHKKSKTKSKTKEYQEKKKEKLKRDKKKDFIPLRDSQVNEFFFVNPIVDKNKDDFVVDPSPYPEFELLEPDLRKKRFSVKIPAKSTSFGTGNTRRKSRTNQSGALTIKVEKLDDAIMEDKSNEEKSENDYEDNQSDKDYEFLFEPCNQQEAARKRVKSFRKSSSNKLQSNHRLSLIQEKDEIDPYLQMESDDNIFEVAKVSLNCNNLNIRRALSQSQWMHKLCMTFLKIQKKRLRYLLKYFQMTVRDIAPMCLLLRLPKLLLIQGTEGKFC
jgi:hypothetical protein